MANIADFKAQMLGGGARPNQFFVQLTFPEFVTGGIVAGQQAQFMCKAAQLPASNIENIQVLYRGRPVNFAGERTFQPWTITVYNDTSFGIRNAFERWQSGIQNYSATNGLTNVASYQKDMDVIQLDRNGAPVKTYKFIDAYPVSIGAIALDFDQQNSIETFDVEFQFNYFVSNTSTDTNGQNFSISTAVNTPVGTFPIQL